MANNRDDFSQKTIDIMAKRVGYRCSNPNCRKLTCGANHNPFKFSSIGVAAHICAAAPGGKRYDSRMSPEERKDIHNGLWLCQSCSKLIDTDELRFTVDLLHKWKRLSEEATILELESISPAGYAQQDKQLIQFYVQCFDRPAFRDDVRCERRVVDFDKAIEDTIIALNTGILRTRDGAIIKQSEGKSFIQNPEWREKLYNIVDILTAMRRRIDIAETDNAYRYHELYRYRYFADSELTEWLNNSREEVLRILSSICREAGIPELHFARRYYSW